MKTLGIAGLALAAVLGFASVAHSAVIYNNGGPNSSSGNDATQWVQAEDFGFGLGATVGGAGVYIAGFGGIGNWDGALDYWIFGDSGGSPGAILTSGAAQNLAVSDSGVAWCCGGNAWLVDFDFASNFAASAGITYWLGIHLSTNFDRDDIYWVTTATNGTTRGNESNGGTFNNWFNNGQEHAYYLKGARVPGEVPAPAALSIVGLGLAALGLARRRIL